MNGKLNEKVYQSSKNKRQKHVLLLTILILTTFC